MPFETMNTNSLNNQLKRSMRQMRGFDAYLLSIPGSEAKASFLANFAGLSKDDMGYEERLSSALDGLLLSLLEAIDEAVSAYDERDQGILKAVAARSLKRSLADAVRNTVEEADVQLAELRNGKP